MTRVFLAGSAVHAREAFRDRLESAGLIVADEARTLASFTGLADGDVLAIMDLDALPQAPDARRLARSRALVWITNDGVTDSVRMVAGRGWAVLPPDTPSAALRAAITAAAHGFAVVPARRFGRNSRDSGGREIAVDAADSLDSLQEGLTPRELEVLELLGEGLSNRRIADRLAISEHTVKFHLSTIYSKLGAANRADAVRRGLRQGLIAM